jgi:hypothetical protein
VDQLWESLFYFQGKFLAFYQYAKSFNSDDFDYEELKNGDYVFMRWKVRSYPVCLPRLSCASFWSTAPTPDLPRMHLPTRGSLCSVFITDVCSWQGLHTLVKSRCGQLQSHMGELLVSHPLLWLHCLVTNRCIHTRQALLTLLFVSSPFPFSHPRIPLNLQVESFKCSVILNSVIIASYSHMGLDAIGVTGLLHHILCPGPSASHSSGNEGPGMEFGFSPHWPWWCIGLCLTIVLPGLTIRYL